MTHRLPVFRRECDWSLCHRRLAQFVADDCRTRM